MTLRRALLWLLALLFLLLLAGGWYARVAWDDWRHEYGIGDLQWQGIDVSLTGVQLERFSVTTTQDGQRYSAAAEALSLGWSWHWYGPVPDVASVGRLTVDIPAWPGSVSQNEPGESAPAELPLWLPDQVIIDQLILTLPQGIRAEGDLAVSQLSRPDERELVTNAMRVETPIPATTLAGWALQEGRVDLLFSGRADPQTATVEFEEETKLALARMDAPDSVAQLDNVRMNLAGTTLHTEHSLQAMALESLEFEGPVVATAAAIHQPQLRPQPWRLDGRLQGSHETFRLDGTLSSDAGASANVAFRLPFKGIPALDANMITTGAKGNQVLADTFTAWPGELEIGEGSINTTLALRFPEDGLSLRGEVGFDGLGGLFGRTAWSGLDGEVAIELAGDRLDADTSGLAVATVNPGIVLSELRLAGGYSSKTEQITAGTLRLGEATAELLGGSVRIEPGEWHLSEMPLRFPLELSGIELSQLMEVYPAEGLAGSGILRGTVPLRIGKQGISIDGGKVEAQAPGGSLKLPADRLRGMAQNNEAMALVVQAMENFNYTVLNSTVDYDEDGKLILGLRLEGSSPEVRDGHPIVLNINLEEDIPALLTSLQLSGRVNEAVTEKVRNLLEKRDSERQ
ncbi:YdbH domain-containing protein [Marinobacter sp. HL-58]|uniref:YdbH domain-containing protein n=1 Tax=Marinobacter sp. HL-58 TaxID=1479237 RepID=UPI0018CC1C83|nr:YdbH domain-containing protein [Marinobacter sp. HL-58]